MKKDIKFQDIIGIRREDKNVWERRTPLTPEDCWKLIKISGIKIMIQPSELRCYSDEEYKKVGCEITEDLSSAKLIICVKEVPKCLLLNNKTYLFFSHTIKAQECNMPMLHSILERNIRLIDYECIKDQHGLNKGSSRFAGIVGAIDFIQGIGRYFLHKMMYTPFLHDSYSYMHPSLEAAKESIIKIGKLIKEKGIPQEICPLVFGITSNGVASQGVQEILSLLPNQNIRPDELKLLHENCKKDASYVKNDRIYIVVFSQIDMYKKRNGSKEFDKADLYKNPQNYESIFPENCLPYTSMLFNCIYWDRKYPRLISFEDSRRFTLNNRMKLQGVCDITCDLQGSIELLKKFTSIEKPFYLIDSLTFEINENFDDITKNSILLHAVDHLPAELPIESSNYFSCKLYPYVPLLVNSDYPCEFKENQIDLPKYFVDACITWNGKLTPKYDYLGKHMMNSEDIQSSNLEKLKLNKINKT